MKTDLLTSEAKTRANQLRDQLQENHAALKATRRRGRTPLQSVTPQQREQLDAAARRIIDAKAAHRLGEGSESSIHQAQEDYDQLASVLQRVKNETAEEAQILTAERALLQPRLAEALAELEGEAAEHMRKAADKWLGALAAFIEANDALHTAELTVEDAGATPPIRAARGLIMDMPNSRDRVPALFTRQPRYAAYYAAELEKHRALTTRTHLLKREHDTAAAQAAEFAQQQAKYRATADNAKAKQRTPARRPTLSAS